MLHRSVFPALLLLVGAACQRPQPVATAPAASEQTRPPAPLRNTRWVLNTLNGQPVIVPENGAEPYLLLRLDEPRAEGQAACNRFFGQFELPAEGHLRLGGLGATRRACPQLAQETAFLAALGQVTRYRIVADTLWLSPDSGTPLLRLHAVYLR
ncbi:META domain-containing protein [Hymenobacter sp. B81]|uniref:META domain-containing protein n=1 Tax=Hymenobacter sp. B81 TaxID=3344878 RepID=UPI0037DCF4B6